HGNGLDVGVELFQAARGAGEGAAGAQSGDEVGNLPLRLLPDFRRGTFGVRLPVGRIVVLVGVVQARIGGGQFTGHHNRPVGAFQRISEDQLGTVCFEDGNAFWAGVAGQGE